MNVIPCPLKEELISDFLNAHSQDSRVKALHSNRGMGELLLAQLRERLFLHDSVLQLEIPMATAENI